MKKAVSLVVFLSLLLSLGACAAREPAGSSGQMVSGGGMVEFSSSGSSLEPAVPESPPAVDAPSYAPIPGQSSRPGSSAAPSPAPAESSASSASSAPESPSPSSGSRPESPSSAPEQSGSPRPAPVDEVRAVWFSYLDLWPMINGKTAGEFTKSINRAFDAVKEMGLNTVFAQVRPFGDAIYDSAYFPASYLYTGVEGPIGSQPYDALAIMVEAAHSRGLRIEAWMNPYRVSTSASKVLSDDNPVYDLLKTGDAVRYNGGIYYDPGSPVARELILDGVREVVDHYDVDGVHFDDYFYPASAGADFDADTYAAAGTDKSLAAWRREQVDILVRQVYEAVGGDKVFGISPTGNNANNRDLLFCNVEKWVTNPGYVDYLCPQIYFGFQNAVRPYAATVDEFDGLITQSGVKLYVGLAACYAGGAQNSGAEWAAGTDMLARQLERARQAGRYGGFALYRYDSLFNPDSGVAAAIGEEIANLREIL